MNNIHTPRTLAECRFVVGHQSIEHPRSTSESERVAGVVLATLIGVLGALALLHWWAT